MDGESAFPDGENIHQVVFVLRPLKYNIIQTGAHNRCRDDQNDHVQDVVRIDAGTFGIVPREVCPEKESQSHNNAIPVNFKGSERYCDRINHENASLPENVCAQYSTSGRHDSN